MRVGRNRPTSVTDLTDWLEYRNPGTRAYRRSVSADLFDQSIRPVLPELARLLNISCSTHPHQQTVRTDWSGDLKEKHTQAMTLKPENPS